MWDFVAARKTARQSFVELFNVTFAMSPEVNWFRFLADALAKSRLLQRSTVASDYIVLIGAERDGPATNLITQNSRLYSGPTWRNSSQQLLTKSSKKVPRVCSKEVLTVTLTALYFAA